MATFYAIAIRFGATSIVHRRVKNQVQHIPIKILTMIQRTHWVLLSLSLITVIGAAAGSHGWMLSVG